MELIGADGLAIGPPRRTIARDIGFSLPPGGILAVLGPNGAGKTTLFRTLLGLLPARGGTVRLCGEAVASLRRAEVARRVAYVPQAMSVPFPYTALDYVMTGRTARLGPFAGPGRADEAAAGEAMAAMGVAHLGDAPVTRLSGGERQLLMIARALAQDAPAVLLDEPASALDFGNRERLADLLETLAARGLGLVFTSHDPSFVERVARRVLTIDARGCCEVGPAGEMLSDERLSRLYGLDLATTARARRGQPAVARSAGR